MYREIGRTEEHGSALGGMHTDDDGDGDEDIEHGFVLSGLDGGVASDDESSLSNFSEKDSQESVEHGDPESEAATPLLKLVNTENAHLPESSECRSS